MKKLAFVLALFALIVAAAAYLYLRAPAEYTGPVPELVAFAPHQAEWVIFADLAAWRASPMLKHLQKLAPEAQESAEYREFVNATGFDYSRDLDRMAVALIPDSQPGHVQPNFQPLAIADGRFSRPRITSHVLKNGSRETHDGQELLVVRGAASSSRSGSGDTLLTFLSDRRVALADAGTNPRQLQQARERILAAAQPMSASASLTPLAERAARVTGAPFFAVGRADAIQELGGQLKGDNPMIAQAAQVLSTVKWITVAARPEQDHVRISILGECESAWQATQLGLLLDGLRLLAQSAMQDPNTRKRLNARELELLETTLASTRVERRSNIVELRLEVSADALALAAASDR